MKRLTTLTCALAATPALAHHEVVVATSMVPLMGGLAAIAAAGLIARPRGVLGLWASVKSIVNHFRKT